MHFCIALILFFRRDNNIILVYYRIIIILIDTEFNPWPDNHLTMKALVTLEWGMNIPVLTELKSRLCDFKDRIEPPNTCAKHSCYKHMFDWYTTFELSFVIKYIKWWMNSASNVQPTWRNFFGILKDISPELGQLAYQIKEIFNGKKYL